MYSQFPYHFPFFPCGSPLLGLIRVSSDLACGMAVRVQCLEALSVSATQPALDT